MHGKNKATPINIKKEIAKRAAFENLGMGIGTGSYFNDNGRLHGAISTFFDPFVVSDTSIANLRCVSRAMNGSVSARVLREIARKAWVINICIGSIEKKIKPFLKPSTDRNLRGFVILKKGEEIGSSKIYISASL